MCFSATASFATAGMLSVIGLTSLYRGQKKFMLVALIPLFFAMQQLCEGLLWLSFQGTISPSYQISLSYGFLAFAYCLWPWWIPWALFSIEQQAKRKTLLHLLLYLGIVVSAGLAFLLFKHGVQPMIIEHHIAYRTFILPPFLYHSGFLAYVATVVLPFFISSRRGASVYGSLVFISLLVSWYLWSYAFGSLWCFWAALLSISILIIS